MSSCLKFSVEGNGGREAFAFDAQRLVCCGWAGRNRATVEAHIEELAELGVPRPGRLPTFMSLSTTLLTHESEIAVVGDKSSGEVEYVLLRNDRRWWVSVGSDHTDRDIETKSIPASKQMCAKYVADTCWPYEEVAKHWDDLILRCWVVEAGERTLYQEGPVASILSPLDLLGRLPDTSSSGDDGLVIFSGTIATASGLVYAERYEIELEDPLLKRRITGGYGVKVLPQYV
jgi:Protein of unknown function (DUF2848)